VGEVFFLGGGEGGEGEGGREGREGGEGGGGWGRGAGGGAHVRAHVRACVHACARRLTCPLLPDVNGLIHRAPQGPSLTEKATCTCTDRSAM
jgi:hypothetical protein